MSNYSVAEAKNKLPELIDRAQEGEDIVITRHGRPVAELRSIPKPTRRITPEALDWLDARRLKRTKVTEDAETLVSKIRDEGEH